MVSGLPTKTINIKEEEGGDEGDGQELLLFPFWEIWETLWRGRDHAFWEEVEAGH